MNYFEELNKINVSDKVEKKAGLSYLSWSYAWGEIKKKYPKSNYKVYENNDGWNYFSDGRTAWVKTGVTIVFDDNTELEHIEYLPVMDNKNRSIALNEITSFDVNKAIQRSLTKAIARHGLGLYIYAGEDLPEEDAREAAKAKAEEARKTEEAYKDVLDTGLTIIDAIVDPESAQTAAEVLKSMENIKDSTMKLRTAYVRKLKEQNIVYDKDTGSYLRAS